MWDSYNKILYVWWTKMVWAFAIAVGVNLVCVCWVSEAAVQNFLTFRDQQMSDLRNSQYVCQRHRQPASRTPQETSELSGRQFLDNLIDVCICMHGVTVSISAFLACHQCYCTGSSLAWGLNLCTLMCGIFWSSSSGVFSRYSGFLPSFIGLMVQPMI